MATKYKGWTIVQDKGAAQFVAAEAPAGRAHPTDDGFEIGGDVEPVQQSAEWLGRFKATKGELELFETSLKEVKEAIDMAEAALKR